MRASSFFRASFPILPCKRRLRRGMGVLNDTGATHTWIQITRYVKKYRGRGPSASLCLDLYAFNYAHRIRRGTPNPNSPLSKKGHQARRTQPKSNLRSNLQSSKTASTRIQHVRKHNFLQNFVLVLGMTYNIVFCRH